MQGEVSPAWVVAPAHELIAGYFRVMVQPFVAVPSLSHERMPEVADPGERASVTGPVPGRDLTGLGLLARYAASAGVTDLFVNGEAGLWVDAGLGPVREPGWRCAEAEVRALAVRLIALGGRHIDEASPCVDVRLADGIRVHAVLPPVSSTGTLLSIRLPRPDRPRLDALAAAGLFGSGAAGLALSDRLRAAVHGRENLLVTGAAGSGKTTLLAALLGEAPPGERIVVIEDVAELQLSIPPRRGARIAAAEPRGRRAGRPGRVAPRGPADAPGPAGARRMPRRRTPRTARRSQHRS
ncbi:hypothetical protein RCH22_002742 [Cryobacterium psychrotolerans]|nr:hypothetical protein [Cryobacterium psychrotolerans]